MNPTWVTGIWDPVILMNSKISLFGVLLSCQDAKIYIEVFHCGSIWLPSFNSWNNRAVYLMVCNWISTSQPSPLSFFLLVFKVKVYMQLKWIQLSVPKLRIPRLLQKTVELKVLVDKKCFSSASLNFAELWDLWKQDLAIELLVNI